VLSLCFSLFVVCIKCSITVLCAERQHRVEELQGTFAVIKSKAESRQSDLEGTLTVAEKFWENMNGMLATLKELQDNMTSAEPPGLEPETIHGQQEMLEVVFHQFSWFVYLSPVGGVGATNHF